MEPMLGLNIYTAHTTNMPCDDTVGVYAIRGNLGAGVLRNSECRVGAWGAWIPETNVLTIGPVKVKAGLMLGLIAGYARQPIGPLVVPSAATKLGPVWYRLSYLPRAPGAATDGWHISMEFDIK